MRKEIIISPETRSLAIIGGYVGGYAGGALGGIGALIGITLGGAVGEIIHRNPERVASAMRHGAQGLREVAVHFRLPD